MPAKNPTWVCANRVQLKEIEDGLDRIELIESQLNHLKSSYEKRVDDLMVDRCSADINVVRAKLDKL